MPAEVITQIDQITPAWLTAALMLNGTLTRGAVATIGLDTGAGNWSKSARLSVTYTPDAQGSLPQRLFLKMVNTDLDGESFSDSEVAYYTRDYVGVENAPLLRCYAAAYSQELKKYHLLFDDVSETHILAAEKEPTLEYGQALAEGLAVLHARWWGAAPLAEAGASMHSPAHIQRFVDIAYPGVEHILSRFASELKPHWLAAMRALFVGHLPVLIQRAQDLNGFTLIHGDAGAYNILVPRHGDRPLYLIDRQPFDWSLTTWLGVYDLAYALVLDWEPELRRQYEFPILQTYHEQLRSHGVTDYTWEQLVYDYRLCAAMGVYIAVEYCRGGVNERWIPIWLPMLERSLTACEDLDCYALC